MFSFQPYQRLLLFLTITLCFASTSALAQDEDLKPSYVTARLFIARVPKGRENLTNQVFRMRTPVQAEDEKWLSNIKKAYSDASDVALVRVQHLRLFMTPKPGIVIVGNPASSHIEVHYLLAQGLRADDTVNTTGITEVNFYSGPKTTTSVPLSMATNGFEVEPRMTYFFTTDGLKLRNDVYTVYFRDRSAAPMLEQYDHYLIVSLSLEPERQPILSFDNTKSAVLQSKAVKKVEPQWSDEVKKNQFFGQVQVRVNIGADGKVVNANVWQSTVPEGNSQALAAAKQWEFPTSELAGINPPASALLTFAIAPLSTPKASEPKAAQPTETKSQGQATPTGKPTTAKKPPVKRRNK